MASSRARTARAPPPKLLSNDRAVCIDAPHCALAARIVAAFKPVRRDSDRVQAAPAIRWHKPPAAPAQLITDAGWPAVRLGRDVQVAPGCIAERQRVLHRQIPIQNADGGARDIAD